MDLVHGESRAGMSVEPCRVFQPELARVESQPPDRGPNRSTTSCASVFHQCRQGIIRWQREAMIIAH